MTEHVVLVDESNRVMGTAPKSEIHEKNTPLHRGFSLFLFNTSGKLLLQQRSHKKKTWPLVWSNSCCGHPQINETNIKAAERRLQEELRILALSIEEVAPYRYKATKDGIMENENCPILFGYTDKEPTKNTEEVEDTKWIAWKDFLKEISDMSEKYSVWCIEEASILKKNSIFKKLARQFRIH